MTLVNELVPTSEATGYVREVPTPADHMLEAYLNDKPIQNIEAAWSEMERVNRAAEIRAWDAESQFGKRDSFSRKKVKMVPVDEKLLVGEEEELVIAAARTGGDETDALTLAAYDDLDILTGRVHNRVELGRGEVLSTGKFDLDENGLKGLVADYGVDPSQFITTDSDWLNDPDADVLREARAAHALYKEIAGVSAGFMIGESALWNAWAENVGIAEYLGEAGFVGDDELARGLRRAGLPPFVPCDTKIRVGDSDVRTIASGKLIFVPQNPDLLGYTGWGVRAESLVLTRGTNPELTFEEAPGLIGTVKRDGDPVRTTSLVGAVFLPVITGPRYLMVLDVTGPAGSA